MKECYIFKEKLKKFEYHRDRSCFLMLGPMMASIYIIAYEPGTHSVYSHSSTIQLVLWHVLTEIHVNKIHQVHLAIVKSIILLQTLDALTTAETHAAKQLQAYGRPLPSLVLTISSPEVTCMYCILPQNIIVCFIWFSQ